MIEDKIGVKKEVVQELMKEAQKQFEYYQEQLLKAEALLMGYRLIIERCDTGSEHG